MVRSFPEKTFEHWCAIHLGYRYRAHLHMWWPAIGADIDVARVPGSPGKRIWLELKTTEWMPTSGRHELSIDLVQLEAYGLGPVPDYYVFPAPPWNDELRPTSPWLGRLAPGQIAYQSQSDGKWFAEWTHVVPGSVLRHVLAADLARIGTGKTNSKLLAWVVNGHLQWRVNGLIGQNLLWKPFWEAMQACGSTSLAAQFWLPPGAAVPSRPSRDDLVAALAKKKAESQSADGGTHPITAFSPTSDGTYRVAPNDGLGVGFDWNDAHRSLVFLGLDALRI